MKENTFINEHYHNRTLHELLNKVQLHILSNGYAKIQKGWKEQANPPSYSRLYYVLDGEATISAKGCDPIMLSKGHCYLIPSDFPFDYFCTTFIELVFFQIKLCAVDGIDLLGNCQKPLETPINTSNISTYTDLIYKSGNLVESLKIKQEIFGMLFQLMTEFNILLVKNKYSAQVKNALEYIDSHLSIQLSISEIAANVYMAPSSLCRDFKRDTQMTIGQYMHKSIMGRAEQLLLEGNYSVADISEILGFCDQSYFTQRFKKNFGMTPTEYKQQPLI